jgi:hypothetical protein
MNTIFTSDISILFFRLLTAHLITDFLLQKKEWIDERRLLHYKSPTLYLHTTLTMLFAYVLLGQWSNWQIPLFIFITHTLIDIWKSYRPDLVRYFAIDQLMHMLMLLISTFWITSKNDVLITAINYLVNQPYFWIYCSAYLFVTNPLGIAIGLMIKKFKVQLNKESQVSGTSETLADAGKWIGIFERLLILTFVLNEQFGAIGFLIAAKSILRFNNKDEERARKETEYVLVGTLISYAFSIFTGLLVNYIIKNL